MGNPKLYEVQSLCKRVVCCSSHGTVLILSNNGFVCSEVILIEIRKCNTNCEGYTCKHNLLSKRQFVINEQYVRLVIVFFVCCRSIVGVLRVPSCFVWKCENSLKLTVSICTYLTGVQKCFNIQRYLEFFTSHVTVRPTFTPRKTVIFKMKLCSKE